MSKFFKLSFNLTLLFFAIGFVSCGDDNDVGGGNSGDDRFFKVDVDGVEFSTSGQIASSAEYVNDQFVMGSGLNVGSGSLELMTLHILDMNGVSNVSETTYTTSSSTIQEAQMYYQDPQGNTYVTFLGTASGTLTITNLSDTEVEGTFSGTFVNLDDEVSTKELTNGSFKMPIE